jgi:hypothetical protein
MGLYYGDKNKWFIGIVKEISGDRSRVRVRIFGIHHIEDNTNLSDGNLPWAAVVYPVTGSQVNSGSPSHDLQPGTWVIGFFADGDECQRPIVTGVFNGGENSSQIYNTQDGFSDGDSGEGGSTEGGTFDASVPSSLPGKGNAEKIYNYFYMKLQQSGRVTGDIHTIASTIVGNLVAESSLNPGVVNSIGAAGLAQWLGSRRRDLERFAGVNRGVVPSMDKQLAFMWHEFNTTESGSFRRLIDSRTIEQAADAMVRFERNEAWRKVNGTWIVDTSRREYQNIVRNARAAARDLSYSARAATTPSNVAAFPNTGV